MKKLLGVFFAIAVSLFFTAQAFAFNVTLGWDPSPSTDVAGYKIWYGTASGFPKNGSIDVGDTLTGVVSGLPDGQMTYFVVTAYDWEGLESGPSNEVRTDGVVTPDTGANPTAPGGCYIQSVEP